MKITESRAKEILNWLGEIADHAQLYENTAMLRETMRRLLSVLRAGNWREVHTGRRGMQLEVIFDFAAWERLMEQVEAALIQQPVEPVLAKHQPCGCVICTCEDEQQCQGCGAKHCGNRADHPPYVGQQPSAVNAQEREMTSIETTRADLAAALHDARERMIDALGPLVGEAFDGDFDVMRHAARALAAQQGGRDDG